MRKIFHLELKTNNKEKHRYYGSLLALFSDGLDLGVSKYTLDRYDFNSKGLFENSICIIRKSVMKTKSQLTQNPKPQI